MKRRVVGKVRRGQNVPQIFKGKAADPGIFHDVLGIIDGKKAEAKIADVQDERRHDQQQERDRIGLPRSRNDGGQRSSTFALLCLGPDSFTLQLALLGSGTGFNIAGFRLWAFPALTHRTVFRML